MATKQETINFEKDINPLDQAQKELKIEPYCKVSIIRRTPNGDRETLYTYDLPRDMMWEYMWVIEWRKARFVCMYPKGHVELIFSFYDKNSGLEIGYDTLLTKQVTAKALVTRYTNAKARYIATKRGELFFDEATDEFVKKFDDKIARAQQRFDDISKEIETAKLQQ